MAEPNLKRFNINIVGTAGSGGNSPSRPIGYASAQQETIDALKNEATGSRWLPPLEDGKFKDPVLDTNRRLRTEGYKPFFIEEFKKDPSSSYRFIGSEVSDWSGGKVARDEAIADFIKTGQVRGETSNAPYRTYFSKGEASTAYLPTVRDAKGETAKNLLYQLSERFDSKGNPLYSVDAGFTGAETKGYHNILLPKENPSFSETVNPLNRRGIKLTSFDTAERFVPAGTYASDSMMYTKPVVSDVIYDRTKPFYKTSLTQNLKNLDVEAKILGNAKLPTAVAPALGAAGGLLSMAGQVYGATRDNMYDREYGMSDPFGTRPAWDFVNKIAGVYEDQSTNRATSIPQAWREMGAQVRDPEYLIRNPITGTIYNLATGNTQPAQDFIEAYRPFFTKSNSQRFDITPPR